MHMAADAGVSLGVVVSGALIEWQVWLWIDPVVSLVINAVIVWGTWGLLRDSVGMSMAAIVCALPLVLPLVYFMMKRLSK